MKLATPAHPNSIRILPIPNMSVFHIENALDKDTLISGSVKTYVLLIFMLVYLSNTDENKERLSRPTVYGGLKISNLNACIISLHITLMETRYIFCKFFTK